MPNIRILSLLLAMVLLSAGAHAQDLSATCPNGLNIAAAVVPKAKKPSLLSSSPLHALVQGTVVITNPTSSSAGFSNRYLYLSGAGSAPARAYIDSPASHVVDFSEVPVPAGGKVSFKVYWPSEAAAEVNLKGLSLACRL